jgi:hypothetical protein
MKPWFNTAIIIMLTLIWIIIGWQLHKRLSHVELTQRVKEISEFQQGRLHDIWHKEMKK